MVDVAGVTFVIHCWLVYGV